jgi:hypothetical protein
MAETLRALKQELSVFHRPRAERLIEHDVMQTYGEIEI